ncbi:MFS transporter [Terriglobus sp.]|uniref:MFS transporter n=1 Tax=Terriglobus sp. TaxID=1889013 RepID=UPI003AFFE1C8
MGVSSMYLAQPLLPTIGQSFHASASQAGLVAVATQVGYAGGLLCCVPLGDIVERRGLMTKLYAAVAVALLLVAVAPTLPLLVLASVAAGALACVTHVALPIAPDLAKPKERGKAIGIVMTGLLLGVLLARTFAGWINDLVLYLTRNAAWKVSGWRVVFLVAAVVSACFAPAIRRLMPVLPPKQHLRYADAMRSLWTVFREEPLLRESSLMGALVFGSFSVFWNTLAFVLQTHGLGAGVAGSFGLVGAAGALMAAFAGKLSDRRGPRYVMSMALAVLAVSYGCIYGTERLAEHQEHTAHLHVWLYLGLLALAVIIMDVGAQASQIANQTRIFALRPDARSRVNTVYMVSYFTGAAISSALSTLAWQHYGVNGTCGLSVVLIALAVMRHVTGQKQLYRRPASIPDAEPVMFEM